MGNGIGGYEAKGRIEAGVDGTYTVNGYDSNEPRQDASISFGVRETGWAVDYETGPDKNGENDQVFYPNVTKYLGELAESGSIVLLHVNETPEGGQRIDVEVQFDLRR